MPIAQATGNSPPTRTIAIMTKNKKNHPDTTRARDTRKIIILLIQIILDALALIPH